LKQFIEKAAQLSYESVEFAAKRPHCSPLDMSKQDIQEIKQLLASKGLELACIASYHDFSTFFEHKDMAYMEKELVYMRSVIELAHELGCKLVRTYTGYSYRLHPQREIQIRVRNGHL
jgi:sugar phosphate isomerase/epimerase